MLLFVLTVPLSNPWVRGDGVGYYAFARSLLIEHRLDFTKDWLTANTSFRMGRHGADGDHFRPNTQLRAIWTTTSPWVPRLCGRRF